MASWQSTAGKCRCRQYAFEEAEAEMKWPHRSSADTSCLFFSLIEECPNCRTLEESQQGKNTEQNLILFYCFNPLLYEWLSAEIVSLNPPLWQGFEEHCWARRAWAAPWQLVIAQQDL